MSVFQRPFKFLVLSRPLNYSSRLFQASVTANPEVAAPSVKPAIALAVPDELRTLVENVARANFPEERDPMMVKLDDPILKFKVLAELMDAADRNISNLELNNIETVKDALAVLARPELNLVKDRNETVQEKLEKVEMPPNMHWVPARRFLLKMFNLQDNKEDQK